MPWSVYCAQHQGSGDSKDLCIYMSHICSIAVTAALGKINTKEVTHKQKQRYRYTVQAGQKRRRHHSYACSLVYSDLSWWGLKRSLHLHVAHSAVTAEKGQPVITALGQSLVCARWRTSRLVASSTC
jgi:hypothetical protein